MQTLDWAKAAEAIQISEFWVYGTLGPVTLGLLGFLGWITVYPLRVKYEEIPRRLPAPALGEVSYRRIGVAVEFANADTAVLERAAALARAG